MMKRLISITLSILMLLTIIVPVGAVSSSPFYTCSGAWNWDEKTGVLSGGAAENGENHASTEYTVNPSVHTVVSIDMQMTAFTAECGAGLFFDTVAPGESTGVHDGMGVMTWNSEDWQQLKTWSWNQGMITTDNPGFGDYWWQTDVIRYGDLNAVYTITAEFDAGSIRCTITNKNNAQSSVMMEGAVGLTVNTDTLYIGVITLHSAAKFSNLTINGENVTKVENEPVQPDPTEQQLFTPCSGVWNYDEATGMLKGGRNENGEYHAGTYYTIDPNTSSVVSVDMQITGFSPECGAGLFFDTVSPAVSSGIRDGMGVMTWESDFWAQLKTWSWNQGKITTDNPDFGDYWWDTDVIRYGNTSKIYTITAEFNPGTIRCTITDKLTGNSATIVDAPVGLTTSADKLYVGVIALHCAAAFSNLTINGQNIMEPKTPEKPEEPDIQDSAIDFAQITAMALRMRMENLKKQQALEEQRAEETAKAADSTTKLFEDVSSADSFYADVKYVYENGYMNGMDENRFAPDDSLTRAMIVTVLYRMEGSPAVTRSGIFRDVESGVWYADSVEWAAEHNIVSGYGNGLFGTNDPVTREQLVAIFFRYADYKGYDLIASKLSAEDADDVSAYATVAVKWAATNALIAVDDNCIRPAEQATRAEVAGAIHAFLEIVAK